MKSPVPVVLNCFADWSNPCRKLVPILQKHALQAQGKWALANLNIDEFPDLMNALHIKIVPTLMLIYRGNAIHKLEGMPDDDELNQFLGDIKLVAGVLTDEEILQGLLAAAKDFLESKQYENAISGYLEALKSEIFRNKYEYTIYSNLAKAHFGKGELPKAEDFAIKAMNSQLAQDQKDPELLNICKAAEEKRIGSEYHILLTQLEQDISENETHYAKHAEIALLHLKFGLHQEAINKAINVIFI